MTVAELIEKLEQMPQDACVLAEGNDADTVILENCNGNEFVRIYQSWNVNFVIGSAGIRKRSE